MVQVIRWLMSSLCLALLVSCGGGGGGESAPVTPTSSNFNLSTYSVNLAASTGTISATSYVYSSNLDPKTAILLVSGPSGAAIPSWLNVSVPSGATYAQVSASAVGMSTAGTYSTVVRVTAKDSGGVVLSFRDVAVNFTVTGGVTLSIPLWGSYSGDTHPSSVNSIKFADGTKSQFSMVGGSIGSAYFLDLFSSTGDGTANLNSSSIPLDRSIFRTSSAIISSDTSYPKNFTYLMRVAPVSGVSYGASTYLAEFELAFGSGRIVGAIRNDSFSGLQLSSFEEGGIDVNATIPDMSVAHTYQVSVSLTGPVAGTVTIYLDGNSTPLLGPLTTTNLRKVYAAGQNYIQYGDNRDKAFRSNLDWMYWSTQGAYTPADLAGKLPAGLGVTTGY